MVYEFLARYRSRFFAVFQPYLIGHLFQSHHSEVMKVFAYNDFFFTSCLLLSILSSNCFIMLLIGKQI